MPYDRATLLQLSNGRLAEARVLADANQPSGAYYLAGYAIECALKAKIAGRFRANEIPDRGLTNSVYTHDLTTLLKLAGLEAELEDAIETAPALRQRWAIAKKWSEQSRYAVWTPEDALGMIDAVAGNADEEGLLSWLTNR